MTSTAAFDVRRWRRRLSAAFAATVAVIALAGASPVAAAPDGPSADDGRLVPVPVGCTAPPLADLAFIGTVVGKDHLDEFVRFRIDQLRSGSARRWAVDGLIDVRYGIDYRFIDEGEQYLVGAGFDPEYGRLSSKVRPDTPMFGGNDVVGLEDASIECPEFEDPVLTLHVDGDSVDSGVLSLLFEDRRLLVATVAVPVAIAFAVMFALVLLRFLWGAALKGVFELGRSAVTPTVDHRAVRIRAHRTGEEHSSRF